MTVIGLGRWSTKVQSALRRHVPDLEMYEISARKFLDGKVDVPYSGCTIWVCSRPEIQIDILQALRGHNGPVVLEKPIARSKRDFEEIRSTPIFNRGLVRFSRVWNYSEIWKQFTNLSLGKISKIQVNRGGFDHGSSIPLAQDWAPHDIYLLCEYLGEVFLSSKVKNVELSPASAKGIMEVTKEDLEVEFKFGKFEEVRVAEWIIKSDIAGTVRLDFTKQKIYFEGKSVWEAKGDIDAITEMYLDFENLDTKQTNLALSAQELFWNQTFENDLA